MASQRKLNFSGTIDPLLSDIVLSWITNLASLSSSKQLSSAGGINRRNRIGPVLRIIKIRKIT